MGPISPWLTPEALARSYAAALGLPLLEPVGEVVTGSMFWITRESLMFHDDNKRLAVCEELVRIRREHRPRGRLVMWFADPGAAEPDMFVRLYFCSIQTFEEYRSNGPTKQGL